MQYVDPQSVIDPQVPWSHLSGFVSIMLITWSSLSKLAMSDPIPMLPTYRIVHLSTPTPFNQATLAVWVPAVKPRLQTHLKSPECIQRVDCARISNHAMYYLDRTLRLAYFLGIN